MRPRISTAEAPSAAPWLVVCINQPDARHMGSNRKSHPRTRLQSPAIHHQNDDLEVDRRNNSKAKAIHSAAARCARAGSRDDELELEAKYDKLNDSAEFRRRDEEEGRSSTVTARSWGAALS